MKNPLAVAVLIALAVAPGCHRVAGSGTAKTDTRALAPFHAVRSTSAVEVEVAPGDKPAATVTADDNVLPLILTDVADGTLVVHVRDNTMLEEKTPVVVKVTAPKLDAATLSGSGALRVEQVPAGGPVELADSGSGALSWQGSADDVRVHASGSGKVTLAGTGKALDVRVTGSGTVDALGFVVDDAHAAVSGSGDARVNANKSLDASVSGSGDVRYAGSPSVKSSVTGSGSVKPAK